MRNWIILVLLIMSCSTVYATSYLPGRCLVQSEFRCTDRLLMVLPTDTLSVSFTLTNQLENAVYLDSVIASVRDNRTGTCAIPAASRVEAGNSMKFTCNFSNASTFGANVGGKLKVTFQGVYATDADPTSKPFFGEIADGIYSPKTLKAETITKLNAHVKLWALVAVAAALIALLFWKPWLSHNDK